MDGLDDWETEEALFPEPYPDDPAPDEADPEPDETEPDLKERPVSGGDIVGPF